MSQVTIILSGPQASGKTVLAEFIARQLQPLGLKCTVHRGGNPRGPEADRVVVQGTTPELLKKISETK